MKVGDKIICMDDSYTLSAHVPKEYSDIERPKRGIEYTIREVVDTGYGLAVRLVEIVNKRVRHDVGGVQEPAFMLSRFKKSRYDSVTEQLLHEFAPIEERLDSWIRKVGMLR